LVALALTVANVAVKPVLMLLTIPVTVLAPGLFLLAFNAIIILLVD
jgi:putative membrane protein